MDNSWTNDFIDGLHNDFDQSSQPKSTYRQSLNGRVFFNQVTGSLSWQTSYGNQIAVNLNANYGKSPRGYIPIGYAEFPDLIAVLSCNSENSEIGILSLNVSGNWSYQTCYNDQYDPNGGLLNFSQAHDMQSVIPNIENQETYRIYFTDFFNIDRVFNLKEGVQAYNPDFTSGSYNPLVSTGLYPPYYSAFSMDSTPQFNLGSIDFIQTISGEKTSGIYQYAYRLLTKDGYETAWTMATFPLFLTSDDVNGSSPFYSQQYAMQASNVATNKGIQVQVNNIDVRYNQIQVCYIYSIVDSQSLEANVFATVNIDGQASLTFNDISMGGTPVALASLNTHFSNIQLTHTMNVREKRLFKGNIQTEDIPNIDGSQITVIPTRRTMLGDETSVDIQPNPFFYTQPYTNTTKQVAYYLGGTTTPVYNNFQINTDYINYQGMQVAHLYAGYFRDEWYRFGILLFDLYGNPWYVTHVCDIQMPAQYNHNYTTIQIDNNGNVTKHNLTNSAVGNFSLTDNKQGTGAGDIYVEDILVDPAAHNPRTRALGLVFSNIDLTDVIDKISGFAIVRVERDPTILGQGLILPMVHENTGGDSNKIRGIGYPSNRFTSGTWTPDGEAAFGKTMSAYNVVATNYFAWSCPDYIFDNTSIPTLNASHNIQMVAGIDNGTLDTHINRGSTGGTAFGNEDFGNDGTGSGNRSGASDKTYWTRFGEYQQASGLLYIFGNGNYQSEMTSWTPFGFDATISPFDPANPGNVLDGYTHMGASTLSPRTPPGITPGALYDGGYHDNAICINTNGVSVTPLTRVDMTTDVSAGAKYEVCYGLANYIISGKTPYGGVNPTSISQSIFYSTGHFQPINAKVKSDVLHAGRYIFNNVEVWGGDCYVNYYGLARVYAQDDNANPAPSGSGYNTVHSIAIGNVFPCEMKYNSMLRNGNTWAKSGFQATNAYSGGVSRYNFEAQTINNVLTYRDTNFLYNGKPVNLSFVTDFSQRWYYSNIKIDGELIDSWRQYPVNQFDDAEGVYGKVMGSFVIGEELLYSVQERGFSRIRATDRSSLKQDTTDILKIGVGDVLDSFEYISTEYGTLHSLSIATTGKYAYWIDAYNQCVCRFGTNGFEVLSDIKGTHNLLASYFLNPSGNSPPYNYSADNPSLNGGITAIYDRLNREVLFTFINNPYNSAGTLPTLGFSELNEAFSGQYSFFASKYFTLGKNLLSFEYAAGTGTNWGIWLHNSIFANISEYYGAVYDSILQFVITVKGIKMYQQVSSNETKVFSNQDIFCDPQTLGLLSNVALLTDYTTDSLQPNSDSRCRNRENHLYIPLRGYNTSYRTRGSYLEVTYTLNNTGTKTIALIRSVKTTYRLSRRDI